MEESSTILPLLDQISDEVKGNEKEFRDYAEQQNSSISSFAKDLGKHFDELSSEEHAVEQKIGEVSDGISRTSDKIDHGNELIKESISVQNSMLSELKNMTKELTNVYDDIDRVKEDIESGALGGNNVAGLQGLLQGSGSSGGLGGILSALTALVSLSSLLGGDQENPLSGIPGFSGLAGQLFGPDTMGKFTAGAGNLFSGVSAAYGGGGMTYPQSGAIPENAGMSDTVGASQRGAGGSRLSVGEMAKLAKQAGFSDEQAAIMGAIGAAESGGRSIHNDPSLNGTDDSYGIWQINMKGNMGPTRRQQFGIQNNEALYDPATNAKAAYQVWKEQGFGAWSTYQHGDYLKYLGTARQALSGDSSRTDNDVEESPQNSMGVPAQAQPSSGNMNWMSFLKQRSHGANIESLNPVFGQKLAAAIAEAEQKTGQRATIVSGYRSTAEQAVLYDRYKRGIGGLAAPPGRSRHEKGNAVDLADGAVREALRDGIDSKHGIEDLYSKIGKDKPHFQLAGAPNQGGGGNEYASNYSSAGYSSGYSSGGEATGGMSGGGGSDIGGLTPAFGSLSGMMGMMGMAGLPMMGLGMGLGGIGGMLESLMPMMENIGSSLENSQVASAATDTSAASKAKYIETAAVKTQETPKPQEQPAPAPSSSAPSGSTTSGAGGVIDYSTGPSPNWGTALLDMGAIKYHQIGKTFA